MKEKRKWIIFYSLELKGFLFYLPCDDDLVSGTVPAGVPYWICDKWKKKIFFFNRILCSMDFVFFLSWYRCDCWRDKRFIWIYNQNFQSMLKVIKFYRISEKSNFFMNLGVRFFSLSCNKFYFDGYIS